MSPPKTDSSQARRRSQRRREPSPNQSDEQIEETPRPRRKLKRKAETPQAHGRVKRETESPQVTQLDSDDSEEPVLSSPIKRRRTAVDSEPPETPRASAGQDELDIEEDVRDLKDSGTCSKYPK